MGHHHHHHHHHHPENSKKLFWAVVINLLLTFFQVLGGILSGSLSLLADALHNFSDAGALIIAAAADKISKLPADQKRTYGYRRAEIIGALVNSTSLVVVGLYLVYEGVMRFQDQKPIDGWMVVGVASIALVIDLVTAILTYSGSKESINMRAAFIHNLSDALASVVVIVSGVLIGLYQIYFIDLVATIFISIYVLYHAYIMIKECVRILMQSVPEGLNLDEVVQGIGQIQGVENTHHVHVWQLDDKKIFFEGHIVVLEKDLLSIEEIKKKIRAYLQENFSIEHTTLEIELGDTCYNHV